MNSSLKHEQPEKSEREWLTDGDVDNVQRRSWCVENCAHNYNQLLNERYGTPSEFEQRIREDENKKVRKELYELDVTIAEYQAMRKRVQELKATISKMETVAEFTVCENTFDELIFVEKGKCRGDRYVWGKNANHYKKGDKLYLQTRIKEGER